MTRLFSCHFSASSLTGIKSKSKSEETPTTSWRVPKPVVLKALGNAFSNLAVDTAATSSLTPHLHFSIHKPSLDPSAELFVVLDRVGVKELGQGCLDLLIDLVKLVAVLALVLVAHAAAVLDSWDGGNWVSTHGSTGCWRYREWLRAKRVVIRARRHW